MKKVLLFAACLFFLTGLKAQLQAKKNTQQTGTTAQLDSVSKAATVTTASRPKTSEKNIKLMTAYIKAKPVPKKKPNVEKPAKTEKPVNR